MMACLQRLHCLEPSATTTYSAIYRIGHTDNWACHNCKQRGDTWFMQKHLCREQVNRKIIYT